MIVLGIQQRVMAVSIGIKIMRAEIIANTFWLFLKTPLKGTRIYVSNFFCFCFTRLGVSQSRKKLKTKKKKFDNLLKLKRYLSLNEKLRMYLCFLFYVLFSKK